MYKYWIVIIIVFSGLSLKAQEHYYHVYYPQNMKADAWKLKTQIYYVNHNNSNSFINEFANAINQSQYIDQDLKDRQSEVLESSIMSGRILKSGFDFYMNSRDHKKGLYYYFGLDHQQVLDSRIDENMVKLLFYGNNAFAGENLSINNTDYSSLYFNRIKLGIGKYFKKGKVQHEVSAKLAFNIGQNYDAVQINNSNFYTHPQGDYLDVDIQANTQLADTAWGDLFTVNGMGASIDLHYSVHQKKAFFIAINLSNLGFVNWNKSPFVASVDTSFRFSGLENDSLNQEQIPNDFSYDNLRNLLFKNPSHEVFNELLPFDIQLTGGQFFADGRIYVGVNTQFYPTLLAYYRAEVFATYNYLDFFQVTPIFGYNSYHQFNIGLAVGFELWDSVNLRAGTSYLNSMFNPNATLGQGGYLSLSFIL